MRLPAWWPWKKPVFKYITIHLRGPICSCKEQKLSWATGPGIVLACTVCKVLVKVPAEQFTAYFDFEVPYPGKVDKEKTTLKAIDGGKVLPFEQSDDEPK